MNKAGGIVLVLLVIGVILGFFVPQFGIVVAVAALAAYFIVRYQQKKDPRE